MLLCISKNVRKVIFFRSFKEKCFYLNISVGEYKLGKLLIEGKTKQVYELTLDRHHCLLLSKDRITAGDGVKAHDLKGKAVVSNKTTSKVFEILNSVGKIFTLSIYI